MSDTTDDMEALSGFLDDDVDNEPVLFALLEQAVDLLVSANVLLGATAMLAENNVTLDPKAQHVKMIKDLFEKIEEFKAKSDIEVLYDN